LKNFEGTSLPVSFSFDLFYPIFITFFLIIKYFFPISLVFVWPLASRDINFKIIQITKKHKRVCKIIKNKKKSNQQLQKGFLNGDTYERGLMLVALKKPKNYICLFCTFFYYYFGGK